MATNGDPGGSARPPDITAVTPIVQELLSAVPEGCTWLLPVVDDTGAVGDFLVAAVSDRGPDIYQRGVRRVGARLSELYPSMVGGPLWQLYEQVLRTGEDGGLPDFRYAEHQAGIVAESEFAVSVHPALGGLLVWWRRVGESRRRLERTEMLGNLGWAEYDPITGRSIWSPGMYRIFDRDPALGPPSRAEQALTMVAEDRGLNEAVWQTMAAGGTSDVTVRYRVGEDVKHVRVLSEAVGDADGNPLKIYAVLQDVTARESSRTAIDRLRDQVHNREMRVLAEHRLTSQLLNLIQPVPEEPFPLAGLEAVVSYVPAESAVRVGGDWYYAQDLPDGTVALAIGDVAGHGLDAANGMAHLRFSLIGWLSTGVRDPGTLLTYMNQLCLHLGITGTAVVAVYDPATGTLSWARAGHMPPLLARAGRARPLRRPPGILLGATPQPDYGVEHPQLRPGDVVLFYTDGLVERRSTPREPMLGDVTRALEGAPSLPRLRAQLHTASRDDDTCTLAVRVLP